LPSAELAEDEVEEKKEKRRSSSTPHDKKKVREKEKSEGGPRGEKERTSKKRPADIETGDAHVEINVTPEVSPDGKSRQRRSRSDADNDQLRQGKPDRAPRSHSGRSSSRTRGSDSASVRSDRYSSEAATGDSDNGDRSDSARRRRSRSDKYDPEGRRRNQSPPVSPGVMNPIYDTPNDADEDADPRRLESGIAGELSDRDARRMRSRGGSPRARSPRAAAAELPRHSGARGGAAAGWESPMLLPTNALPASLAGTALGSQIGSRVGGSRGGRERQFSEENRRRPSRRDNPSSGEREQQSTRSDRGRAHR